MHLSVRKQAGIHATMSVRTQSHFKYRLNLSNSICLLSLKALYSYFARANFWPLSSLLSLLLLLLLLMFPFPTFTGDIAVPLLLQFGWGTPSISSRRPPQLIQSPCLCAPMCKRSTFLWFSITLSLCISQHYHVRLHILSSIYWSRRHIKRLNGILLSYLKGG